ncbi:MAG: glutathione S-transferase family protein [Methylophilaceae bacterium]
MNNTVVTRPASPIKLYGFPISGHSHRVELFLSLLGLPTEVIYVDLPKGAHKLPEFTKLNIFGQVPVIQDGEVTLADSIAILVYLARKYDHGQWLPEDPVAFAEVQRWLSVAAGLVAFGPAAARLVKVFNASYPLEEVQNRAYRLFEVMENVLQTSPFLVGTRPTIADIANYTYIAHAPEGDISLAPYPHIRAWLSRIEALPGFVAMNKTVVGA